MSTVLEGWSKKRSTNAWAAIRLSPIGTSASKKSSSKSSFSRLAPRREDGRERLKRQDPTSGKTGTISSTGLKNANQRVRYPKGKAKVLHSHWISGRRELKTSDAEAGNVVQESC